MIRPAGAFRVTGRPDAMLAPDPARDTAPCAAVSLYFFANVFPFRPVFVTLSRPMVTR